MKAVGPVAQPAEPAWAPSAMLPEFHPPTHNPARTKGAPSRAR
jgi:hypothetical protein